MTEGSMGTPTPLSETLTDDERVELEKYRADRAEQDRIGKEESDRNAPPVTHRLFLANGESVESAGTMTVYNGIPVLNAVPIPKEER